MPKRYRIAILVMIVVMIGAYMASLAPIAQHTNYHVFADRRTLLGIPNLLNVASNLPFLFFGMSGLFVVFGGRAVFADEDERWPYAIFFVGVALTSAGSSYYHLHPDNARLVWDRLPMALGFMGILSAVVVERISRKAGLVLMPLFASAGIGSVLYWYGSEISGRGDLWPYGLVQFGSLSIVLASLLLFPSHYSQQKWFFLALAGYVIAKALETFDQAVYGRLRVVSGHTLKHISAAAAAYCIAEMLRRRETRASCISTNERG